MIFIKSDSPLRELPETSENRRKIDGVNSINENRTPFGPNKAGPEGIKQI